MKRNKLLLLLVLLMAVSGAWAQDAKHLITATYREQTRSLEQPLPYATTIGELFEAVTGEHFSGLISSMSAVEMPLTGISSNNTSVVSIGELNGASTPVTVIADGKATISINFGSYAHGIFVSVTSPLYAYMKDGVKDADKWTVKVGEGQAQALPIGGLKGDGSETVTLQYNGRLKVKGVKATSDAAAKPDLLSGVFSVSASKKVNFSKGNLQATYDGSNWTWAFANNQWDYIGNSAGNTKVTDASPFISENGTVDLFGWVGASSTWDGVNQYGITSSKARNVTNGYGNSATENLKKDWGAMMGTGWFTLSKDEWTYLLNTRSASNVGGTADGRYAKAKVNDVQGIILFPDTYTHPDGVTAPTGVNATGNTGWNGNSYTVADWTKMETAGCVFLPAAGSRDGNSVSYAGTTGTYWWSTHYEGGGDAVDRAYNLYFTNNYLLPTAGSYRDMGCSVRLVQATTDAEQAKTPATVTTAPKGAAIVGVKKSTELVSGGAAEGGTMMYKVTTENTKPASTDGFSDAVPTAQGITASGKVYVWYYVKGDDTHTDSEIAATAIEVTVKAFPITVTWNPSDIVPKSLSDESFTKDGITFTATTCDFQVLTFGGGGSFTTTLGNFTKIEISADFTGDVSGTGWSNDGWQSATWTGNAASVSFSGDIWGGGMTCEGGNLTIVFTID